MKLENFGRMVPWWGKVVAKILLSRLPAGYPVWQKLGLFRHGAMDQAEYALNVFNSHVERAGLQGNLAGKTILELGPGDSVASAIIACGNGARAILVDVDHFATGTPESYLALIAKLREKGYITPDFSQCKKLEDLLSACDATYLTDGLKSLKKIDNASIDLIYSQAVLEHLRRHEFLQIQQECARILGGTGVCSHRVDLRDHLGGGLNNLRFSENLWESEFFVQSGFYTNRIQLQGMVSFFEQAGFKADLLEVRQWKELPIKRSRLADKFKNIPDQTLNIAGFDVLLKHQSQS